MYQGEWHESIRIRQPAAGAPALYRMPGETYTRLDVVRYTITTSAAAGNRYPTIDILDGDDLIVGRITSATALAAATARAVTSVASSGTMSFSAAGEELLPGFDALFPPGFELRLTAVGLDVGDQLSAVVLHTRRYPSGAWEMARGARPVES